MKKSGEPAKVGALLHRKVEKDGAQVPDHVQGSRIRTGWVVQDNVFEAARRDSPILAEEALMIPPKTEGPLFRIDQGLLPAVKEDYPAVKINQEELAKAGRAFTSQKLRKDESSGVFVDLPHSAATIISVPGVETAAPHDAPVVVHVSASDEMYRP